MLKEVLHLKVMVAGRVDPFQFFQHHLTTFTFILLLGSYDWFHWETVSLKGDGGGEGRPNHGDGGQHIWSQGSEPQFYHYDSQKTTFNQKVWIQEVLKKIDHHNIDKEVEPFTEGQVSSYSMHLPTLYLCSL